MLDFDGYFDRAEDHKPVDPIARVRRSSKSGDYNALERKRLLEAEGYHVTIGKTYGLTVFDWRWR